MKKILILVFLMVAGRFAFAQDGDAELKNFRFGLKGTPSFSWYKPDDKKKFENGGLLFKFGWGLAMEFRLSKIASLATGLQVDYDGGSLRFKDTAFYFFSKDEIIAASDTAGKVYAFFRLDERDYKVTYITLPFALKMKTNEIGYMTYFGQFGLNTSIKTKTRVNDKVLDPKTNTSSSQQDLDITDDMNFLKFALTIGAGFEYTFSGSTALTVGINYINGFSNVLKSNSKYLLKSDGSALKQKATGNGVALTVGVLF
jgi:hypothetical protein